jgi:hypothetical protein
MTKKVKLFKWLFRYCDKMNLKKSTEKKYTMHLYHANQTIRNARDVFSDTYRDRPIPSIGTIFNSFKI